MRNIKIIEHISLDGVIQAPGGPKKIPATASRMADGRRRMTTHEEGKPSLRPMATISICCWAAEPMISGAAFGRTPRKVLWLTR